MGLRRIPVLGADGHFRAGIQRQTHNSGLLQSRSFNPASGLMEGFKKK